jgi:bleomycin hydrolase
MKTIAFITALLLLVSEIQGQTDSPDRITGSWLGTINISDNSEIRVLLTFHVKDDVVKGILDSPDQGIKGMHLDSVWIAGDSLFTDHNSVFGPGIVFKGIIRDSVIDGKWLRFALKLRTTTYVYTPQRTLSPVFDGYKILNLVKSTPLKDQQNTGTCWASATTSFIETEALRLGHKQVELSPMFYVTPTYVDKAERYIRMHGNMHFTEGDLTFSVFKNYQKFGAIPEKNFPGKIDTSLAHDHFRMNKDLLNKVKYYVNSGRGTMTCQDYRKDIRRILDHHLGEIPAVFTFEGRQYTPESFAREYIGIDPDAYLEITSFGHHPFYSNFRLEMPSNWNNNAYFNLPIQELLNVVDHALENNYSVCWDGDIMEGCSGEYCQLPNAGENNFEEIQQKRQKAFDNYTLEDFHNMHIIGKAENKEGKVFYILKNSNGGNYLYMSKEFLLLKTISILVNRNALPSHIIERSFN